jgi:hypothetical protein
MSAIASVSDHSDPVRLNYRNRSEIEQSELRRRFSDKPGSSECIQIFYDWKPALLKRVTDDRGAEADTSDYKYEVDDSRVSVRHSGQISDRASYLFEPCCGFGQVRRN